VGKHLRGDRGFGLVFATAFLLAAVRYRAWYALVIAAGFLVAALVRPSVLARMNRWWMRLGHLLSRVTNPIMTAALFYGVLTPVGLVVRACGWDALRLAREPAAASYWLKRSPPGSMSNQF